GQLTSTTSDTSATIESLTQGTQAICFFLTPFPPFCSTEPGVVGNLNVIGTTTSSVSLSWTQPKGNNSFYRVEGTGVSMNTTETSTTISGLTAGVQYNFTVTTVAGDKTTVGEGNTTATFTIPNPPGPLNITERTTSSLAVQWKTPDLMTGVPGISYNISYYSTGTGASSQSTASLRYNLLSLSSGTFYTITVITVGPQDLGSAPVNTSGYTLPTPVVSLTASPLSTSSVKLQWTDPVGVKSYYSYRVRYSNATGPVGEKTVNTSVADIPGLEPGTGYNFTVTTVAAVGSNGLPELTFSYTQPKAVSNLVVKDLNTTAIKLSWSQQDDHQPTYSYLVTVSKKGSMVANVSTTVESYTFTHLQPGDSYTFSVVTVVQGVKSDSVETSSYTKPGVVTNIATTGTTTTMNVTWDAPVGQVDSYTVTIHNDNVMENSHTVSNDSLELVFLNLKPGKVYVVRVVTNSGPLTEASLNVTNATYPNPPGTQKVEDQTTGSINISWARPLDMDLGQYRFSVFYLGQHNLTEHNWILMENLQSGTLYNITVVTVGPLDYQSTAVTTAGITPTDVTLVWDQPENKAGYSFKVEVTYPNGSLLIAVTVNNTKKIVTGLQSGSNYTFTVTTLTKDGTMATPVKVSYYTSMFPSAITILIFILRVIYLSNLVLIRVHIWDNIPPLFMTQEAVIPELTPGTNCTFRVSVKAQVCLQLGQERVIRQCAMCSVQPSISNNGSTNTMVVSWAAPPGNVGQYVVHLNSTDQVFTPVWLNSNQQTHTFIYLSAGREYTAVVTTISGPFNETSGPVTTATQPNPPGPIGILEKTTSSITVEWGEAPLMANTSFSYLVKYLSTQLDSKTVTTTNTSQTLPSLSSGTPYNVSVVSVGVLGFHSEEVWSSSVTTSECQHAPVQTQPPPPPETFAFCFHNYRSANLLYVVFDCIPPRTRECPVTAFNIFKMIYLKICCVLVQKFYYIFVIGDLYRTRVCGVLLADVDQSNSSQYLVKTYQDWEAGSTTAYLATVKDNTNNSRRRKRAGNIDIDIGDKTSWKGYTNGQLKAKREYRYEHNTGSMCDEWKGWNLQFSLVAHCFLVSLVFVLMLVSRVSISRTVVVRVEDYEAYYKKQRADSNCGFAEEFEDLKLVGTAQAKTSALAMENKSKNRYNNVLPYDSSRVKLSIHGSPFDDYINSNYIPGYNSRKEFIAAQGPLPGTVNEFWRMIWEKNVQTLVMLTRCNEQGRVKCEEYYPSETKHFENITVTTTSEIPLEDWTIRDFDVKNVKTVETRSVRHFHFTAWPDHGVPETTELLINFRHLVREHMDQYSRHSPTVVHCSAGVGRTGTFIAIDRLIFQIERESMVDVYGTIHDLRMHRPLMVQTEEQYVFLNQCAMDIIRSRTGTNVDLIYQNTAALTIYENVEPRKDTSKNGYHNA
uniref:protein-tyrosine-phosphatase n=1 Tax=Oncorhynchus kisutch TaxID=8019 RepID=A0A8C7J8E2_ONCKI